MSVTFFDTRATKSFITGASATKCSLGIVVTFLIKSSSSLVKLFASMFTPLLFVFFASRISVDVLLRIATDCCPLFVSGLRLVRISILLSYFIKPNVLLNPP